METYTIKLTLQSDTTFGRGDGVAGLVDAEVEHDRYGLPYLRGRTLKGLLAEECANIVFSLRQSGRPSERWEAAAQLIFGRPGSALADGAGLHFGDARLPADLREAIIADIESPRRPYTPADVLDSLTAIRRQTAMDPTGVPSEGSLRAMRVILRETCFEAEVHCVQPATDDALMLLAACARATRRIGTGRNRGRGRVIARLCDAEGATISPMRTCTVLDRR